ncbi:MAG: glycosyltransferase family 2 protein [Bacilli bacterium]|nr:glycosyltransferase family 2 protein [Bacilli bacterium]MBR1817819.1 glycosyltransferase family 2 protein [Bacilli bacterium]
MISFVILHYKNLNDTLECIKSIQKLSDKKEKSIIIVDNHTLDEKGLELLKEYTEDIILLNENLGFAKANNEGCKYAIAKYHPDFLCVINNDTVIQQKDFVDKIYHIYEETNFDMLGPYIECKEGSGSVNPYQPLKNIEEVRQEMIYQQKLLKYYQNAVLYFLLTCGIKIKRIFKKREPMRNGTLREENVALHGCAIIFSKKYYEAFESVFYPNTFLYHEESFLYQRIQEYGLISIYDPSIKILHKEGASLSLEMNNNERKKMLFRTQEIIKSLKLLEQEMQKK